MSGAIIKVIRRRVEMRHAPPALDDEFSSARWVYNRLLDFELEHQAIMDACAPRLARVGRLLARLSRRERWAERATDGAWKPKQRPELERSLESLRDELKAIRNADPAWKVAKAWAREPVAPKVCRRKEGESDAKFEVRQAKAGRSRREVHALKVYAERRCFWATFNAAKASVDQAVKSVIKARAAGMSADLRRPSWRDRGRIAAQASQGGFKLVEYGRKRIRCRMRLFDGWIDLETSGRGALPTLPADYDIREVELVRDRRGASYEYHLCITVRASWAPSVEPGNGLVGIDTGHRWMGDGELRAFVWSGSDGQRGEVRLPKECVEAIGEARQVQKRIDLKFNAEIAPTIEDRRVALKRSRYRRQLEWLGVRTQAEDAWLRWERRNEMHALTLKRRARNLRTEAYVQVARMLRARYSGMAIDTVGKSVQRLQTDKSVRRAVRQHRDLVAAYSFQSICERFGIAKLPVPARNSTRECPHCGQLHDVDAKLVQTCPQTGKQYDQDFAAADTMLRRAEDAARNPPSKAA